ncbi:uncharacterized protein LOC107458784 [Arachis duranensis]|uniref:Uncharacterized protein LOC107458784 n=2 Tax=Arachis TaxID=3817 RepID=A0A6P4AX90_ARADU|nr:uncharacterized protein LOC107458784 [Arachis duranensis]XP_015932473.1 uncharacterized protein LOC107458784 [Arachis duranensis]XP_015932474.1 uncharacterized protein LOC107458784 [Arachis duranensis]XP_025609922.1 uncharacterized protein LOC112702908 [Arachis hypogaea]XP_025609923.1 uncharacterized protein LOC112702908 [Arachis hypogaea]XP_025609924.1 uncharacterized protein LOC112702908 [Arachis hypogaea]XP_025609925.1 uncharacterized protein LOC112702908 [Arachis hypogaea]XP_052107809
MHVYPFGRRPITFSSAITIIYYDSTCHKWEEKQRIQSSRSPTLTFLVMHGNCLQKAKAMKIVCNAIRDTSNLLQADAIVDWLLDLEIRKRPSKKQLWLIHVENF